MSNWYATYTDVEQQAGIATGTAATTVLASFMEAASRIIDRRMGRHFYTVSKTRYYDGARSGFLLVPDLLSVSSFTADTDEDGVYDDETWVDGTDYFLENAKQWDDRYPKNVIRESGRGSYSFGVSPKRYKIIGIWGYGDGTRAAPWDLLVPTATVATTSGTTLTLSAGTTALFTGNTILVGTEQMFISSYAGTGTSVTVERGVNGTTAATHSSAVMYKAAYPREIVQCCKDMVVLCFNNRVGLDQQYQIAAGEFTFKPNEQIFWEQLRLIQEFKKVRFA